MLNKNSIPQSRKSAIDRARNILLKKSDLLFLDTETTGLNSSDEIVEIGIVSYDGSIIFDSLIKPYIPIPKEASRVHGITDKDVQNAPRILHAWLQVDPILKGKIIGIYNDDFDLRMIRQSIRQPAWKPGFSTFDIMKIFAEYIGEWDAKRFSYRYFRLEEARKYFNLTLPNSHRATDDALLACEVFMKIAESEYGS